MKHCIIVKFNSEAGDKAVLIERIKALFGKAEAIEGVHGFQFIENCVERPNRSDLIIEVDVEREKLGCWDGSDLHKSWKEDFGMYVQSKAIFDFEPEA